MKLSASFLFVLITGLILSLSVQAQVIQSLDFITIGASAEQLALGESTTAIATDGLNIWFNPASIGFVEKDVFSANYVQWFSDVQITSVSLLLKEKKHSLAISILSNTIGEIETRNVPGDPVAQANVSFLAIGTGYAYQFNTHLSAGISASYISEQYISASAGGYAIGLGLYSSFLNNKLRLATAVNHLGEMGKLTVQKSKLPTQFRAGADADLFSFSFPGDYSFPLKLSISTDFVHYFEPKEQHSNSITTPATDNNITYENESVYLGVRLLAAEMISIKSGYRFLSESNRSWSAGIGITHKAFEFDFAYIPFDTGFNNAYALGVKYHF